jgi:hypothetical protein
MRIFGNWKVSDKYITSLNNDYFIEREDLIVNPQSWINHINSKKWPSNNGFEDAVNYAIEIWNSNNRCSKCRKKILPQYKVCYKCLSKCYCYNKSIHNVKIGVIQ